MSTLTEKLNEIINKEIVNGGFPGNFSLEEHRQEPCFQAGIDIKEFKKIKFKINPKHHTEEKVQEITKDIAKHEINHRGYRGFSGCPRNAGYHEKLIITPITKVLKGKGYTPDDTRYIANALEDGILQTDLSKEFALDGIVGFLDDVGSHSKGFTDFYEAHVRLNMYLWGNRQQKRALVPYYPKTHNKKVQETIQNFLNRTGISKLKQKITVNGKETEIKDRNKIRDFLNDENNWPEISKIYAEEFSKLMQPEYAMPILNHSGKGTMGFKGFGDASGESSEDAVDGDTGQSPNKNASKGTARQPDGIEKENTEPQEGNEFDREMHGDDYKKGAIKKAYSDDSGVPEWMSHFDALDFVYQMLAKKLNLKVETFTRQSSFPIFHYGKRPFDSETDNFKHIKFGLDDNGKVILEKRRYHEDIPLEYKVKPRGFPEVRFCLMDTSGSMQESPNKGSIGKRSIIPWGDNSKYHFALLAWYGLLEYLKQNHLLKQTNISLGNFANSTIVKTGLYESKRLAFNPQFGSTYIDISKIKGLFRNRNMLVFTISDGEIMNWYDIKDEFMGLAKQHHYFHLQMGSKNRFTEDLKNNGMHVEYIHKASDLATRVIDITDKIYRG